MTAKEVQKALRKVATKERAKVNAWFFKTGKGQYGEGDVFIGVTVPECRRVARLFRTLPLKEIALLLKSSVHEDRLTALLILVRRYEHASVLEKQRIYTFYLRYRKYVNNWDLVDTSASYIVGKHLSTFGTDRATLYALVKSKCLWDRRIAIIATHYFIRQGDFKDTFALSELLSKDTEDLLHKAVGWMLREIGKKDEKALRAFLSLHKKVLPRTTLRYAIERLSVAQRRFYMKK